MATEAYRIWVGKGRPFTLAKPIADLVAWAKANGVSVLGTIGNETHLQKDRPEDHTPFSYTEWPVQLSGYVVCAIDLANVRGLGDAIERQARAGRLPWLKYMNHDGQNISFKSSPPIESGSGDEHVHLSIRTDWATRSIGAFDPWGTEDMAWTTTEQAQMNRIERSLTRLDGREPIGMGYLRLATGEDDTGSGPVSHPSLTSIDARVLRVETAVAQLVTRTPAVSMTEEDRTAIAEKVVAQLSGAFELAFRPAS